MFEEISHVRSHHPPSTGTLAVFSTPWCGTAAGSSVRWARRGSATARATSSQYPNGADYIGTNPALPRFGSG